MLFHARLHILVLLAVPKRLTRFSVRDYDTRNESQQEGATGWQHALQRLVVSCGDSDAAYSSANSHRNS